MRRVMQDRARILSLTIIMAIACMVVSFISIFPLYRTALKEERERLRETARSQARLIEAIAEFDLQYSSDFPDGSLAATLSQIRNAHKKYQGFGKTGEFVLARKEGDFIVFLLSHRHHDFDNPAPVPFDSRLAEPMRLALTGKSGTTIGPDYRGTNVLAAYEPVNILNLGIVTKIDLAEIRQPFIKSIIASLIVSLLLVLTGIFSFLKIGNPLITRLKNHTGELEQVNKTLLAEIESHKNTGKMLKESGAMFRSIFENASDGILLSEIDTKYFITGNNRISEMLGYSLEELKNMRVMDIHPETHLNMVLSEFENLARAGKKSIENVPCIRKDRSVFYAEINGATIHIGGKKYNVGFFRDVTDRKKTEDALRENESFIRTIMENLPIGIAVNTVNPVYFKYINQNFYNIYRTSKDKLKDIDSFWDAVYEDPEYREEIRNRVLNDCASGDPDNMHWEGITLTRKGEETTFLSARNIPLHDENLMISTVWDVTKFKNLEKQLEQAQRMEAIGNLAGGIAHDYNNISSIILGYAELALDNIKPDDPAYEDIKEIIKATERSIEITRQLLAFARKQTVSPKVLDLNDTIGNMLKMIKRLIGEDIDLAWVPGDKIWPVKMDPAQIDQIIVNLCVNARDAIGDVGKITIETGNIRFNQDYCNDHLEFKPGEYVMLAVSDDGKGMTRNQITKIFEPFYTTKKIGKGTGLGLSTVYGIIKQNNGFINVYSEPQKGSTFKIYIPKEQTGEPIDDEHDERSFDLQGKGETIMIVEDDDAILKLVEKMLSGLNYHVMCASNPNEAITLATNYPGNIVLLITDVILPEMNGRQLSERLKMQFSTLKVLYMSGYTANVIAHRGVLDEGINFIAKPFSCNDLAKKVKEALDAADEKINNC
jgi:PAS domain S-box-containing protein